MAISHTLTYSWSNGGGTGLSTTVYASGADEFNYDATTTSGAASTFAANITKANLQDFYVQSSAWCNVYCGCSGNIITLQSGIPFSWNSQNGDANPLTSGNVTSGFVFLVQSGNSNSNISLRSLTT